MTPLIRKIFFVSAMITHAAAFAREGTGSSNGGNSFVTQEGSARFLDLVRLPSTIPMDHEGTPPYILLKARLERHDGYKSATYFPYGLDTPTQPLIPKIMAALRRLKFHLVMNGGPLPDPKDMGLVVVPKELNGRIERFALQNVDTGDVMVDGRLFELMAKSEEDIAAFYLHEALIQLWYEDYANWGPANAREAARSLRFTDKIADIVHMTFVEGPFTGNLSARTVSQKMCEAGLAVAQESLTGLLQHPLPAVNMRPVPSLPLEFAAFARKDCVLRLFRRVGGWKKYPGNRATPTSEVLEIREIVDGKVSRAPVPGNITFTHMGRNDSLWIVFSDDSRASQEGELTRTEETPYPFSLWSGKALRSGKNRR